MSYKLPKKSELEGIVELVDKAHLEDVMEVLGTENYQLLLGLCDNQTEVAQLFYLLDMLLHSTPKEKEIEFNEVGMRIPEGDRILDFVIYTHRHHYIKQLVDNQTEGIEFVRPLMMEIYLGMPMNMTPQEQGQYFEHNEAFNHLIEDIQYFHSLDEIDIKRRYMILYFNSISELQGVVGNYIMHHNLRESGATFKGLYEGTWEDEITEQ